MVVVVVNASKVSIWLHQVYMSMSVSEVRIAVHSFAGCVHDVNEWMRASRLRLNLTKTQVMWLGSGQQLKHVDINDIPLLSTTVHVAESVRDLGVILGSHLTLSAHVAAPVWILPAQTTSPARPVDDGGSCKNRSCSLYFLPIALPQVAALWAAGHSTAQAAV